MQQVQSRNIYLIQPSVHHLPSFLPAYNQTILGPESNKNWKGNKHNSSSNTIFNVSLNPTGIWQGGLYPSFLFLHLDSSMNAASLVASPPQVLSLPLCLEVDMGSGGCVCCGSVVCCGYCFSLSFSRSCVGSFVAR